MDASHIDLLRKRMKADGIDAVLIQTGDYHGSEYAAPFFDVLRFFSGFSGENATLIVQQDRADLWVDGRFFIQADAETDGSGIVVQRMGQIGVPTVQVFLKEHLRDGDVLAFDGRCVSMEEGQRLRHLLPGVTLVTDMDPAEGIWENRPPKPCTKVWILDAERYAGETADSKLGRLRTAMREKRADYFITGKLDEIMWLYNLRANDVTCNPVALSYTIVSAREDRLFAQLYIQEGALTDEVRAYAAAHEIDLHDYDDFGGYGLQQIVGESDVPSVLIDPNATSYTTFCSLKDAALVQALSPVALMKAVKNETEIRNFRDCYLEDSAAVTRFLYWIKNEVARRAEAGEDPLTECDAADYLDNLRAQIADYVELSFGTISAYGPNAAMMHYGPDRETCAVLKAEGMLLVDSGGHYLRGTTDVTRTIALGPVTEDMKRSYTLTAVSQLSLANMSFLKGCSGIALDAIAREPMWRNGLDYKCGTGHGIGYLLNVHEGPQSIRYRAREEGDLTAFVPGMVVSDEPGVYKEGKYGIRIETILLCVERQVTSDGEFYGFEPLTFVPLDPELLDSQYLTPDARERLNTYNRMVYERIAPLLNSAEREWLAEQCREI